jgi:hypothetical protein
MARINPTFSSRHSKIIGGLAFKNGCSECEIVRRGAIQMINAIPEAEQDQLLKLYENSLTQKKADNGTKF